MVRTIHLLYLDTANTGVQYFLFFRSDSHKVLLLPGPAGFWKVGLCVCMCAYVHTHIYTWLYTVHTKIFLVWSECSVGGINSFYFLCCCCSPPPLSFLSFFSIFFWLMEAALFKDAFFKLSHYSGNLKSFILPIEKRKQSSFLTSLKKKKFFFIQMHWVVSFFWLY